MSRWGRQVLTHALQKTVDFEKEMHTRFTLSDVAEETVADGQAAKMPKGTISGLLGTISGCFDSYMGIYVSLEDKEVEEVRPAPPSPPPPRCPFFRPRMLPAIRLVRRSSRSWWLKIGRW